MSTYSITAMPSGSRRDNDASRDISVVFPYDNGTYKTISYIKRTDGVWCSCGGSSQTVLLNGYDQLVDTSTNIVIKTSSVGECRTYGTGPSSHNYMTTIFDSWTQAESNAAVAAWAAGTLRITRTVFVKSFSSSDHGQPTFRDGYYDDTIDIEGATVPFTNYKPEILAFSAFRSEDGETEEQLSTHVWVNLKVKMDDETGLDDNPKLYIQYSTSIDFENNLSVVTLGISREVIQTYFTLSKVKIDALFDISKNYYFRLIFSAGEELATPLTRTVEMAYVPFHIPANNSGIAFGMYSRSSVDDRRFESAYPAFLYGGITRIGEGWKDLTLLAGSTPAQHGGGVLRCRNIENKRIIDGSILVSPVSGGVALAQLPDGYTPYNTVFNINACDGARIACLSVVGTGETNSGKLMLNWVRNLSNGSEYTSAAIWIRCSIEYWVEDSGSDDHTTSVLGNAILGQMILGR